ncbi:hypothetical protein GOBAR_AA10631 [Gossypium barbadense]|uniref:Uncharacterized protein n=2 Tax=Gossypium TaxID=3633 RepID=A0A2P5Y327_GOSBA|nr:hypothetical protein GOBAR_AA10631 [Gossypium barbadense]
MVLVKRGILVAMVCGVLVFGCKRVFTVDGVANAGYGVIGSVGSSSFLLDGRDYYNYIMALEGMDLRPALQRLYMTRASAYKDALKSFIEGYQEGIQQIMDKKEDSSKAQQEGNTDKNST